MQIIKLSLSKLTNEITLENIHELLYETPSIFAQFLVIGTSISSASANVRHSVIFVPQHTGFTAEFSQALVSVSRSQGVQLLFTDPTCLKGFFRLAIPLFVKLTGLAHTPSDHNSFIHGNTPLQIYTALHNARCPPLSPSDVSDRLGLNTMGNFELKLIPPALLLHHF